MTKLCMQVLASANLLSRTNLIETWKVEDLFLEVMWHFELFPAQTNEYVEPRWFKITYKEYLCSQ